MVTVSSPSARPLRSWPVTLTLPLPSTLIALAGTVTMPETPSVISILSTVAPASTWPFRLTALASAAPNTSSPPSSKAMLLAPASGTVVSSVNVTSLVASEALPASSVISATAFDSPSANGPVRSRPTSPAARSAPVTRCSNVCSTPLPSVRVTLTVSPSSVPTVRLTTA